MSITVRLRRVWPRGILIGVGLAAGLIAVRGADLAGGDSRTADFDRRPGTRLAAPGRPEAEGRLRAVLPRVQVERGRITGGAHWIGTVDGFLTGPDGRGGGLPAAGGAAGLAVSGIRPDDPHRVVKAFLSEHAAVFGHDHRVLAGARLTRDATSTNSGVRSSTWQQEVGGIRIHGATLNAHLSRRGELVTVGSDMLASPETGVDAAQRALVAGGADLPVAPARALGIAARSLSVVLDEATLTVVAPPEGGERVQKLSGPGWRRPARLALAWLPLDAQTLRLCWRVWWSEPSRSVGYEFFVDASTGELISRRNLTDHDSAPATYRVYTTESPTPMSPGFSNPVTNQPPAVVRTLLAMTSLSAVASPNGWVDVGLNELKGNNAHAYYMRKVSENSWSGTMVHGSPSRVFDFPLDLTMTPDDRPEAVTANAFYWVNFAHDRLYALGFDEANRNFQDTNFNRGGLGDDSVTVTVNDPGSEDNAGMTTYDEGGNPSLNLGVFTGPNPDRESALDAEIIVHEYCHGLSNRLIGDGTGMSSLQSKGMGEGWSDFYALALTSASTDNLNGNYAKGAYASYRVWGTDYQANYYSGIRRYPYTTDLTKNPLTFKDIDPEQADPHVGIPINPSLVGFPAHEVHMQGEVWCSMLWEMRARLIEKHGFATGNQLSLQLVTDGLKYSVNNPNFTTARNAIVIADLALTGGANKKEIWAAFAKRGLGALAVAGASTNIADIVESFDSLDSLNVLPADDTVVTGPVGGPFAPTSRTFTLTNDSPSALIWRARAEPPLEVSTASGTLAAHAAQSLTVTINGAAAGVLPQGGYSYSVFVTNQTSGEVFRRVFSLLLGVHQEPAERFSSLPGDGNDLANRSFWFLPDESGTNYDVCRVIPSPAAFPVDPASAQTLGFTNVSGVVVALTNGANFPFFGLPYDEFEVRRDGSVVPGAGTSTLAEFFSIPAHFSVPRIAGCRDGYSSATGRVSWKQLADQMVVTWEDFKKSVGGGVANFQLQLYFDGRIRLTFLEHTTVGGICGLSSGHGTPPLFAETDLSASPSCTAPQLVLALPASVTEGSLISPRGTVSIVGRPTLVDLVINLTSSDSSEALVPATVTIPAGRTSVDFPVSAGNDSARDGTQVAFITASRVGYTSASGAVAVHDNETAVISVSLPPSRTEGGLLAFGSVSLNAAPASLVGLQLESSSPNILTVPPVVFVEAGQTTALFPIFAPDNNRIEGSQTATVTASVRNWTAGSDTITVLDNETTNLTMFTFLFQSEGAGTVTNGTTVQISGVLSTNLPVALISDDESEIRTPLFGGFIPAGSTNVVFPLFLQDDAIIDGLVGVQLRAIAGGFRPATNLVFVFDNDGPPEPGQPSPPHLATEVDLDADLGWGRVQGDLLVNGGFETGDFTGWTLEGTGAGAFVVDGGSYDPQSPDGSQPPLAGSFSALSDQTGPGTVTLWQQASIPDGATNVTLSWIDQIRSHGPWVAGQGFRVELRDTNDAVLATLFSTTTNDPPFGGTTSRSADLRPWRGQAVRVAFVEQDHGGYLNVRLDEVHLMCQSVAATFYDVYFGANPAPALAEFQGTTSNSTWALPKLWPDTTYYWQLKSRRNTATNAGPVWQFSTRGSQLLVTLIASNSSWRYLNTGVYAGAVWNDLGYNDSAWPSGPAKLGFGGDGENTVIGSGSTNIVTYWFRRPFTLSHPEAVSGLIARLIRDDGAAVYLNGTQVWLDNLPARFDSATQAQTVLNDPEEKQWITNTFNPSLLVTGQNVIAVEIHQRHGLLPSPDLGFAFELRAVFDGANHLPEVALTAPSDFSVASLPTNVTLTAKAGDTDVLGNPISPAKVEFVADGVTLGLSPTSPYAYTWTNPPPGEHWLTAVVTDGGGLTATSAPVHLLVAPAVGQSFATLIPAGGVWSYLDNGIYPGSRWAGVGYEESRTAGWKRGAAQLGYGDGDEVTVVNDGRSFINRHITTWFRRHFVPPASLTSLTLRVLRDDGLAVYLNGTEIYRNNLPAGPVLSNTLATVSVTGVEENRWLVVPLASHVVLPLINPGDNVIAAEVHQFSANNADMSFDLELIGAGNLRPAVAVTAPLEHAQYFEPSSLTVAATATDAYGAVAKVELFDGGTSLGSVLSPPYQVTWSSPPPGVHTLTAVATDNLGATQASSPVQVTILTPTALSIRSVATNLVELTWPDTAVGYHVESAAELSLPVNWSPLNLPVEQVGGVFRVLVNPGEGQRYFRLQAP